MKGTMLIYDVDGTEPRRTEWDRVPPLKTLQDGVRGRIEIVPYWDHMRIDGERRECVAFCNEEGKLDNLPVNRQATLLWATILENQGMKLRDEKGELLDVLVGSIVVLYGDKEFMEAI